MRQAPGAAEEMHRCVRESEDDVGGRAVRNLRVVDRPLDVPELARILFERNPRDFPVEFSLVGAESSKDLFLVLLDILTRGIVHTFGGRAQRVQIDRLDVSDFALVQRKMANAGVRVRMDVRETPPGAPLGINRAEIDEYPADLPLGDYRFVLTGARTQFLLGFELLAGRG